jgi:hypothetical protein
MQQRQHHGIALSRDKLEAV